MMYDTAALVDRSVKTTAVLVDYNNVNWIFFYPEVEFKDMTGTTIHAQSIDNTRRIYHYMDNLPIIYDPVNPSVGVRVNTFETLWLGPTFMIVAGAFVVSLSLVLHWNKTRKLHAQRPPSEEARGSNTDEPAHITQSVTKSEHTRKNKLLGD